MALGKERFGPFPKELVRPLLAAIDLLGYHEQLPGQAELARLILAANDWPEVVRRLKVQARRARRRGWAFTAGAVLREVFTRLFAKSHT
jgi:hypothetical protein